MTAPVTSTSTTPLAPADASRVTEPQRPLRLVYQGGGAEPITFKPLVQLRQALSAIVHDPFGTVVGVVRQPIADLKTALFSLTPEELANPLIQGRLRQLGVDPAKLAPTASANEVMRASGRSMALIAGAAAGAGVGAAVGPVATATGAATKGAAEALAFGTVGGALTPPEEGQTRAGNVLTWNAIGVPLATLGGVTGFALRKHLRAEGIKPDLETPEISVTAADFDPQTVAAAPPARNLPTVLGGTEIELLMREAQQRAQGAAEMAAAHKQMLTERGDPVQAVLSKMSIGKTAKRPITFDGLYTALIDDLNPINVATKALLKLQREVGAKGTALVEAGTILPGSKSLAPGTRLPGIEDPYVLARLTRGSPAKATRFLETGPLDFKSLQPVGEGLRSILEPIVKADAVDALRAFLVAPRALELAARDIKTPIAPAVAKAVIESASDEVVQASLKAFRYNDQLLQYVIDSGAISAEAGEAMRALNTHYVPFYRYVETLGEATYGTSAGSKFANVASGIRKIKGGEVAPLVDPLESMIRNTYALISVADRHFVGEALVRLAESVPEQDIVRPVAAPKGTALALRNQLGELGFDIPENVAAQLEQAFQPARGAPDGTIWVNRGGKKQYYQVDADLYRALLQLDRESSNTLIQLLSVPASIQRAGFTAFSPTFVFRNPFRDQFTAAVLSRHGFVPGYDLMRGVFHVFGKDELYEQFRRSGGEHAVISRSISRDRVATQRSLSDLLHKDTRLQTLWKTARSPKGWLEGLRRISEMNEEATRSQVFMRELAATGDERLAAFAAREGTLDFQRMGWAARAANQIIPFLNANVQDIDKITRTFGAEGGKRSAVATAKAFTWITLPTIALYMANRDDPNYQELSWARKDFFWNVPLWRWNDERGRYEHSGKFFSVPKPFVLGMVFGTTTERTLGWLDKHAPDALDHFAGNLFSTMTPPILPAAIAPALEAATNYDLFRDRPIIPEGEQRLIKAEQAGPLQGETVRVLAKALGQSPRIVEHLISGYTGGVGDLALSLTDQALRLTGTRRPDMPENAVDPLHKLLSTFVINEPTLNSRSVERFYHQLTEVETTMATARMMMREPSRVKDVAPFVVGQREALAAYGLYIKSAAAISQLRTAINNVRGSGLTPEQKESQIILLGRMVRTIAANANTAYDKLREGLEALDAKAPMRPGGSLVPDDSGVRH